MQYMQKNENNLANFSSALQRSVQIKQERWGLVPFSVRENGMVPHWEHIHYSPAPKKLTMLAQIRTLLPKAKGGDKGTCKGEDEREESKKVEKSRVCW